MPETSARTGELLPRSLPSAERIGARNVLALLDRLDERSVECHSIMVVRHGRVVAEGWWAPYSRDRPHLLYSLTKYFTSFVLARMVERVTGRSVPDLLDDRLFGPMGVQHADWDRSLAAPRSGSTDCT